MNRSFLSFLLSVFIIIEVSFSICLDLIKIDLLSKVKKRPKFKMKSRAVLFFLSDDFILNRPRFFGKIARRIFFDLEGIRLFLFCKDSFAIFVQEEKEAMSQIVPREIYRHSLYQDAKKVFCSLGIELPKRGTSAPSILVALSGGADSVALLFICSYLGFSCRAIHCNFHLREDDSDRDASFVKKLCLSLEIPLFYKEFDTSTYARKRHLSIEMAARELRYTFFEKIAQQENFPFIAIAHHLGDNIETMIQHLIRGCGLSGLRGIPPLRERFVRPFINSKKESILDFLALIKQPYCEDKTNRDITINRNFIRHKVIPLFQNLNPSFEEASQRTFENLRESEALVDFALQSLTERVILDASIPSYDAREIASSPAPLSLLYYLFYPYGFQRTQLAIFVKTLTSPEPARIYSEDYCLERKSFKLKLIKINLQK